MKKYLKELELEAGAASLGRLKRIGSYSFNPLACNELVRFVDYKYYVIINITKLYITV